MKKRGLLVLVAAVVLSVSLAACRTDDGKVGSSVVDDPAPRVAQSVQVTASDSLVGSESIAPVGRLVQDTGGAVGATAVLDAHDIVAAYEQVLGDIYSSVLPSIVQVKVQSAPSQRSFSGGRLSPNSGEGSGFVWSDRGHIVTNHHVIARASQIRIIFADGTEYEAEVLGSDSDSDLAVLSIDTGADGLRPVVLGDSDELSVGQLAVAIGSPFGQEFSMTRGIVSALERAIRAGSGNFSNPQIIQTDAPMNPGNSGGPLMDRHGRVIGINSQIISASGSSSGVGFAVPINTAKRIVPELIANGRYEHAYLGISGVSMSPRLAKANGVPEDTSGILVVVVVGDGPAERAGLAGSTGSRQIDGIEYPAGGEVITAIDGTPVQAMNDLIAYMEDNNRPGDTVALEVLRDWGERASINVTLAARPRSATG